MTTIDMEPQAGPSGTVMFRECWNICVRRKWAILSSVILSLAAAAMFCALATKYYRSETLILVEEQKISQEYVKGVVEPGFEERFFAIQKQIMSRQLLGEVLNEFDLYPDIMAEKGQKAALAAMTKAVAVEMIDKVPGAKFTTRKTVDAFTISFSYPDPTIAMKVTTRIASKFIEDNLKTHEELAEGTTEFFDTEIARTKSELERADDEIKRFKSRHMGELPEQVTANLATLDRLQNDLKAVNETIQRLSDRIAMVERAMQEYHKFGTTNGALIRGVSEPDPIYKRLKEQKEKLVRLRAEFQEGYPEVQLTKEEVRQLEQELVNQGGPDALKELEKMGKQPLDPYLQDLRRQESETKSELAVLTQRQELLQAEKQIIEARIAKAPAIEQEIQTLMRDYVNMRDSYYALLGKRLNAVVAESLEKRQKGAQFRILDPATGPTAPEWPNIPLVMVVALLFGGTAGMGVAMVQEQNNPQFRRAEEVEQAIGLRVLAVIPDFSVVWNPSTRRRLLPYYRTVNGRNEGDDAIDRKLIVGASVSLQGQNGLPFESNIIVKHLPKSVVAEQYRVAAARLALERAKERSTIACVTSAVQGEGKTTTVVNLGYTFARDLGKRTVLVDCDFKRPSLNRYTDYASVPGLADCLRGGISVDDCLYGFPEAPCWIMPVGKCEDESNELLKASRLSDVFDQLRDRFEYIFINAPPILPLADMNVITGHVDVLLLIVRAASTPQQYVKHALNTLMADKPTHLIFNAACGQYLPYYIHDYCEPAYR